MFNQDKGFIFCLHHDLRTIGMQINYQKYIDGSILSWWNINIYGSLVFFDTFLMKTLCIAFCFVIFDYFPTSLWNYREIIELLIRGHSSIAGSYFGVRWAIYYRYCSTILLPPIPSIGINESDELILLSVSVLLFF